eukprot:scaffold7039_cov255-Pinguiococcus_pyrenoidosus.AAC.1
MAGVGEASSCRRWAEGRHWGLSEPKFRLIDSLRSPCAPPERHTTQHASALLWLTSAKLCRAPESSVKLGVARCGSVGLGEARWGSVSR